MELPEKAPRISGTCCGFRMMLNGHERSLRMAEALQRPVIQVDAPGLYPGGGTDTEAVILGSHFNMAGTEILDGLVDAEMAKFQLHGRAAQSDSQKLMPKANGAHGKALRKPGYHGNFTFQDCGIAGTVGKKNAIRRDSAGLLEAKGRGHNEQFHVLGGKLAENAPLDAEIIDEHMQGFARRPTI